MGKKRARDKDSKDEDKENRYYKRLKRVEAKLRKEKRRWRRSNRRHEAVETSDSRSYSDQDEDFSEDGSLSSDKRQSVAEKTWKPIGANVLVDSIANRTTVKVPHGPHTDCNVQPVRSTESAPAAVLGSHTDSSAESGSHTDPSAEPGSHTDSSAVSGFQTGPITGAQTGLLAVTESQNESLALLEPHSASLAAGPIAAGSQSMIQSVAQQPNTQDKPQEKTDEELDEKILELMGKRLIIDRLPAPDIHKDFVVRWQEILLKGLPASEKKRLLDKYPPPAKCTAIDPPKLNPEVKLTLSETIIKKDARVVDRQERIAACLASLGKSLTFILKANRSEDLALLENLSDAARLLADVQHDDSLIRRSLILSNLNTSLKDTLNATVVDNLLFGKNLEVQLKAAKLLEQSSQALRLEAKPKNSGPKNAKGPPRRPPYKKPTQGGQYNSANQRSSSQQKNWENQGKSSRGRGYQSRGHSRKWQ